MTHAMINGENLEYTVQGSDEEEAVILIHGGMLADMYVPLISEPVLANSYRLVTYHRRGYGESSHNVLDGVSIQQQAADCKELVQMLGIERAHIVGHSNAGLIALQLAIDAPSMVHSLALLEPALIGFVPSGPEFGKQLQMVARSLQDGRKAEALNTFLSTVFEGSPQYRQIIDKQLPQGAFESAERNLDIIFRLEAPAFQSWKFTVDDAKRITQPILYIGGENSAHYFQEVRELVSSWFPQAKMIVLPGTSHMLHIMNPEPVADGLVDFFSRHPLH